MVHIRYDDLVYILPKKQKVQLILDANDCWASVKGNLQKRNVKNHSDLRKFDSFSSIHCNMNLKINAYDIKLRFRIKNM